MPLVRRPAGRRTATPCVGSTTVETTGRPLLGVGLASARCNRSIASGESSRRTSSRSRAAHPTHAIASSVAMTGGASHHKTCIAAPFLGSAPRCRLNGDRDARTRTAARPATPREWSQLARRDLPAEAAPRRSLDTLSERNRDPQEPRRAAKLPGAGQLGQRDGVARGLRRAGHGREFAVLVGAILAY